MRNPNGIGEKHKSFDFLENPFLRGNMPDKKIQDEVERMTDFMGYLSSPVKNDKDSKIPALNELGYFGFDFDSKAFKAKAREEATRLQDLGYEGRLYVKISPGQLATDALHYLVEQLRPKGVGNSLADKDLFGEKTGIAKVPKYLIERHGGIALPQGKREQVRLMMFNTHQDTGVDPVLLALNQPFDDHIRDKWGKPEDQTQEEFFRAAQQNFKPENGDLTAGSLRDFESIVGLDRLAQTNETDKADYKIYQLFAKGWARLLGVERVKSDGIWASSGVSSIDGQMRLFWDSGIKYGDYGVFGSMGMND